MPTVCTFELDHSDPIYYSGEVINGRINLHTDSNKSVNEVYILFRGEAKVSWNEHKTRTSNGKTQHYTENYRGKQTYLRTRTQVFGSGDLPSGDHQYTFCIPLPLDCPTSCDMKYGKIFYEISLVIDKQWGFNKDFKQPLTVIQTYNLNISPDLLIPLVREDVKYFCCWPCTSGPVLSTLTIPFGGYAPGQKIHYSLEIDNKSGAYDLDGFELQLKQVSLFKAQTPHYKTRDIDKRLYGCCKGERVLRFSKRVINGTLLIPSVPPTTRTDSIIAISYRVLFSIKMGDCHMDAEFDVPLVIGTIPLAQSAEDPTHVAEWIPHTPDTPAGATGGDMPPSYENCKPPTFEEATNLGDRFIDPDVDEQNPTNDFIPRYPMYTNFALPTAPPESNDSPLPSDVPILSLPHGATAPPNAESSNGAPESGTSYGWTASA
ncbi:arrestin domain-containing protein 3 [Drosophila madeirensis]|uniref:Arrestin domain-containing protein 3 n=1 Tax=Drosophila madeirensis TaxID=30013 RepID=A0AAU9F1H8_DROMD